jgi:hypothetical protein
MHHTQQEALAGHIVAIMPPSGRNNLTMQVQELASQLCLTCEPNPQRKLRYILRSNCSDVIETHVRIGFVIYPSLPHVIGIVIVVITSSV